MLETRPSLILRLPSAEDADAWREFVRLYEPLIFRFAKRFRLQDADASEITQQVMLAVAQSVAGWTPDKTRGKFRTWLFQIARNKVIDFFRGRTPDQGTGKTSALLQLQQVSAADRSLEELNRLLRCEIFRQVAAIIRDDVEATTWEAFWSTSVLGEPMDTVAERLGLTRNAIYIARYRIIQRMQNLVQRMEGDDAL